MSELEVSVPQEGGDDVFSAYEHDGAARQAPPGDGTEVVHNRRGLGDGSGGNGDTEADAGPDAGAHTPQPERDIAASSGPPDPVAPPEVPDNLKPLVPIVLAQVKAEFQQHLHLPAPLPDVQRLAEMRKFDAKLYRQWKKETKKQAAHNRYVEAAPFKIPAHTALRGQIIALIAFFGLLLVAAYALKRDERWFAGVLTALDIVSMIAVFSAGKEGGKK